MDLNGSEEEKRLAKKKIEEADIVLTLEAYAEEFSERLKNNKLTFFYSERLFKSDNLKPYDLRMIWAMFTKHKRHENKNAFMLCNSAFLPWDLHWYGIYKNRFLKWGYFPKTYYIEDVVQNKWKKLAEESACIRLIWVGRLSQDASWKKPEYAIHVAEYLKNNNVKFELKVIGTGECKEKIVDLAARLHVTDEVEFLGGLSNEMVLDQMRRSHIMLFTSNKDEGWGAVLNEAMNAGCCCIASETAGATSFLIEDGKNGLIYHNDSLDELCTKTLQIISSGEEMRRLGENAYNTIINLWNEQIAAKRLVDFCKNMLNNKEKCFYQKGPLSEAELIKG